MEKHRKDCIYERVQSVFGVNVFRCYYHCLGLLLENFKRKLKIRYGQECGILVRFDHIVVEESEGEIIVYLLVSHNSGKCADFLHQGKVDCAFWLIWYSTKRAYVIMICPSCIVVIRCQRRHRQHLCTALLATGFRIQTSYLV